jgi:Tfp pilus assembly protein PilO
LVFWYFVLPLNDQREGLQKEVAKLKADNDRDEAFRQQQTEYLNRIDQLQSQLVTLQSIVPDEQATDEFMRTVFADGSATSTEIRTFIPKPPAVKDYYVETPYSVHLDGTYYDLLSFFDRLAHEQRIMSVSGLSLGGPEGGGMGSYKVSPSETVGANCVLTTYYNKPLSAAPPSKKKK